MNRTKSPLKHDEGNALSHGMRTDEASWHKKNDKKEVVKKEGVV